MFLKKWLSKELFCVLGESDLYTFVNVGFKLGFAPPLTSTSRGISGEIQGLIWSILFQIQSFERTCTPAECAVNICKWPLLQSTAYAADWHCNTCELIYLHNCTRWRHQMKTFSALLAFCVENSPVTGEFPAKRPVTRSSDVLFDLRLNKRLSKQSLGWCFETPIMTSL